MKRLYLLELEELELLLLLQVKQHKEKQTLVPPSRPVEKKETLECAPQKAVLSQEPSSLFHHDGASLEYTASYTVHIYIYKYIYINNKSYIYISIINIYIYVPSEAQTTWRPKC